MAGAFLVTLRETLEAALVIGVILGSLVKVGRLELARHVWRGVAGALLASIGTGYAFEALVGGFEGRSEQIFEGVLMFSAVAVLTFMVGWLQKSNRALKGSIQTRVDEAVNGNPAAGIASLAFVLVLREGVETILFLRAVLVGSEARGAFLGGLAGVAGAIALSWLVFKSAVKLDLRAFFAVTGGLLLLVSAGLLAHGLHELVEAGVAPALLAHVWDMSRFVAEDGLAGSFLKALFGYNANPSLLEVLGWASYLGFFATRQALNLRRTAGSGVARPA